MKLYRTPEQERQAREVARQRILEENEWRRFVGFFIGLEPEPPLPVPGPVSPEPEPLLVTSVCFPVTATSIDARGVDLVREHRDAVMRAIQRDEERGR